MKKVVFTLGRFNPPTVGHAKVIQAVEHLAKEAKADSRVFTTVSHDKTKNPLEYSEKIEFLKQLFPKSTIVEDSKIRTVYQACHYLSDQGYRDVVLVVGEDRVSEFQKIWDYVRKPHDKDYDKTKHFLFDRFHVVSAGKRDAKSKGISGASGTKMREYAVNNDFVSFMKYSPTQNVQLARKIYRAVQKAIRDK